MSNLSSLNLFFGQQSFEDFLNDLTILKEFKNEEIIKLIDKVIEWYPKDDIEKEWENWSKEFGEEELKKKKSIISLFTFIIKELATEKITDEELKEDFNDLNLPLVFLEHIVTNLKSATNIKTKAQRSNRPYENTLRNIDWRFDNRNYNDGTKINIAVIELAYALKGEKEIVQLEINKKALKHFISILSKIEKKL